MANSPASLIQPSSPSFNPRFRCSNSQPPRLRKALSFILLLACLATTALAQSETQHPAITSSTSLAAPASTDVSDGQGPSARAATSNWNILRKQLRKRKDQDVETSSTTKSSETKKGSATTTTLTISIEQPTSSSSSNSSPLPQAFDGNLASEFSSTAGSKCPAFLNSLLASPSFETCYPLSMLIQTSHGFFDAEKQLTSIVRVLDATCAANVTYCTDYLSAAAKNLTAAENCKAEYTKGDVTVKQVYTGLRAYEMMYKASCLQNPSSDMYCFANAVTNLTTPSDAYFYYLPYNLSLPGSSVPSCSWCIEETMAIYHSASIDRSQLISSTYEAAARQVNTLCGLNFVNATLPKAEASSAPFIVPSSVGIVITMLGAALFTSLL